MAHKLIVPFQAFSVTFESGQKILIPINDKDAWRLDPELPALVDVYAKFFQQKVLNKGDYLVTLDEFRGGEMEQSVLDVQFNPSRDGYSFPMFQVHFDFFYEEKERGFWGIIPTLGLESFGADLETLKDRLGEVIKFEFARNRRLAVVQQIVAVLWFREAKLETTKMELRFPNLKELDQIDEERPERLLPKLAIPLKVKKQETFGRQSEIDQVLGVLKNEFNKNLLLVGPSGVGKTALIWEVARENRRNRVKGTIWETTASTLIKELSQDTGWQDNIEFLVEELKKTNDFLFIRNLMELFEVGKYEGNAVSIADYLKPAIARGDLNIISECTEEELAQIELKSPNYLSSFQIIHIAQPDQNLKQIIVKKVKQIAAFQKMGITDDAIEEVLRLNKRFSPYAGMPGKPIRFLENMLINQKQDSGKKLQINRQQIIEYFCEDSGIPRFMIDPQIIMDADLVKSNFNKQLYGQEQAIDQVVDVLTHVKTALTRTEKPIASFLFVGPTGVGKTELAKMLAEFMFGDRQRISRFDMSEYATSYDIIRLVGIGDRMDGLLTSAVRRNPFSVILFDEIEKAHPNFYDLLLQILGEGRLTDGQGKLVNFCSSIIIMTSNIGANAFQATPLGIQLKNKTDQTTQHLEHFESAVQKFFRPEFFNRIDRVIPFHSLNAEVIRSVVLREIHLMRQREGLKFRDVDLFIEDNVYQFLVEAGYNPKYGARQMQRTLRKTLLIPLAKALNLEEYDDQLIVRLSVKEEEIHVEVNVNPLGFDLLIEELEKFTNTNLVSSYRRQCKKMQEQHFFTQFLSELDILNQEKAEKGESFWLQKEKSDRFQVLTNLHRQTQEMEKDYLDLEMNLGLSCMGLKAYDTNDKDGIDRLNDRFLELKRRAYQLAYPDSNKVYFYLLGHHIPNFISTYCQLFDLKGFTYKPYLIIYLERPINNREQQHFEKIRDAKNGAYYSRLVEIKDQQVETLAEDYIVCGLYFIVEGECVHLYLNEEDGLHFWQESDDEKAFCQIKVALNPIELPKNTHRKDSTPKGNPRRTYIPPILRDNVYRINREFRRNKAYELLGRHLDDLFELKLDQEIFH